MTGGEVRRRGPAVSDAIKVGFCRWWAATCGVTRDLELAPYFIKVLDLSKSPFSTSSIEYSSSLSC